MELQPITSLIDPRTRIARTMTATGPRSTVASGYLAFVISGVLHQRRIYDMPWDNEHQTATFIIHKKINYAINIPAKPISGAFNSDSLKT